MKKRLEKIKIIIIPLLSSVINHLYGQSFRILVVEGRSSWENRFSQQLFSHTSKCLARCAFHLHSHLKFVISNVICCSSSSPLCTRADKEIFEAAPSDLVNVVVRGELKWILTFIMIRHYMILFRHDNALLWIIIYVLCFFHRKTLTKLHLLLPYQRIKKMLI